MLTISFGLYRRWGYDIFIKIYEYQKLRGDFKIGPIILCKGYEFQVPPKFRKDLDFYIFDPNDTEGIYKILKKNKVDVALMYSWNYFIREPILSEFVCMCLHPSLVPENRGGTPIQNQIVSGVKNSGLSLFRMEKGIDTGPLYDQTAMSLIGNVQDILGRMTELGTLMTKNLISDYINGDFRLTSQSKSKKYPTLKRRLPSQSEINLSSLAKMNFNELNNLVRGLLSPYPNAFIRKGGKKILIQEIERFPKKPRGMSFKLKDGWAKVVKKTVESNPIA